VVAGDIATLIVEDHDEPDDGESGKDDDDDDDSDKSVSDTAV